MHSVGILNLWGNAVVNMIFWPFKKNDIYKKTKLVFLSNLRLFTHVFSVLRLILYLSVPLITNLALEPKP